jgi:hypothetical protein
MKNTIIIIGLFSIASCTTLKKAESYFEKHPEKANYVAKKYINAFELPGAKICLDAFPPINTIDTISIFKDSLIVEKLTDTLYQWFNDTKYIDKDKIRKVLVPCRDSIKIVSKTIYDPKFEILYKDLQSNYNNMSNAHNKLKKAFFWTWFWVILLAASFAVYKYKK